MTGDAIDTAQTRAERPDSQRKIARILAAARAEFFANGFSAASIEAIAARAEVSKVTIYTWFKTKENLFGEVVKTECSQMYRDFQVGDQDNKSLRDILIHAGHSMIDFLMRDEMVRFDRILASEVNRDPKIGQFFLDSGPRILLGSLIKLLESFVERGEIHSTDLRASAEMLAGLILGRMDLFLRYGEKITMTADEKRQKVERAVDAWMLLHQR